MTDTPLQRFHDLDDPCAGAPEFQAEAPGAQARRAWPRGIYLDNAATSFPKPPVVYERVREYLERYGASPGRGSYRMVRESGAMVEDTHRLLACLFRIREPERIIFTLNATDALNMAIKGVLAPADDVVTTVLEHNSVARPLNRLERNGVVRVTRVNVSSEGTVDPDEVLRALTPRTKLVAVMHASNVTGAVQPITRIGRLTRSHGARFLVDASQTAGALPIDVEESCIDLLAFAGHKGLLGLPGTGGLYVGPRAQLVPWREGGTGIRSDDPLQPDEFPYRLESGSPNTLGLAGLGESLRFILQRGVGTIRAHEMALAARLLEACRADERIHVYGPPRLDDRVAVVPLTVAGWLPGPAAERLDQTHGIAVRAGLHCAPGAHEALGTHPHGTIRISPGCFTTEAEIDACVAALRELAGAGAQDRCCAPAVNIP